MPTRRGGTFSQSSARRSTIQLRPRSLFPPSSIQEIIGG